MKVSTEKLGQLLSISQQKRKRWLRVYKIARVEANKNPSIAEKMRIDKRKATLDLISAVASKKAAVEKLKTKI